MYYSIGQAPYDETWVERIDNPNYVLEAGSTCLKYIALLTERFGPPPHSAHFKITDNDGFLFVVIEFDNENEEETQYADLVGEGVPTWTE